MVKGWNVSQVTNGMVRWCTVAMNGVLCLLGTQTLSMETPSLVLSYEMALYFLAALGLVTFLLNSVFLCVYFLLCSVTEQSSPQVSVPCPALSDH